MRINLFKSRTTIIILGVILVLEIVLTVLFWNFDWVKSYDIIQTVLCAMVAGWPLVIAAAILMLNRFRFSIRFMLLVVGLTAVFLRVSLLPLREYQATRRVSMELISAKAEVGEGEVWTEAFLNSVGLEVLPKLPPPPKRSVFPWLAPFAKEAEKFLPDDGIRQVFLSTDEQCKIVADNWEQLSSLQAISIGYGVSDKGFRLLQEVLPRFEHLQNVLTDDVQPPPGWYSSLTNIRFLCVWGEVKMLGQPFEDKYTREIVSLKNLKAFMVQGYAFDDSDAKTLASSPTIRGVVLRSTAITQAGEDILKQDRLDEHVRIVW